MLKKKLASIVLTGTMAASLLAVPVFAEEAGQQADEAAAEIIGEDSDADSIEEFSETPEESEEEISVVSDGGIRLLADTDEWTTTCTGQGVSVTLTSTVDQTYSFTSEDGADVSAVLTKTSQSSITVGSISRTEYGKTYTVTMDAIGQHTLDIVGSVSDSINFYLEVVDHTYTETVIEPTCTEDGYTEYTCSVCGYSYEANETAALGHEWDVDGAQTEWSESGDDWIYSVEITCERCDAVASASEAPAGVVIEPTCTDDGSTTYTVTDLAVKDLDTGDVIATFSDEKVVEEPALGHDWGDWEIVKEATIGEDGEETRTCSRCGETETEVYQVDTEVLDQEYDELLSESEELNADDYTEESWDAFVAALDEAREVRDNSDSTQEDIDNVLSNLQTAFDGLTKKEAGGLNGVCKAEDGNWYYYVDGEIDWSYNGFASNENGDWWIDDGMVTFDKNSVIQDEDGVLGEEGVWYYVVESKVQHNFTGLADYSNENGWWYIEEGEVDFDAQGVYKNTNGWFYVTGGKVDFTYTGFASNSNGDWYIEDGEVTFEKQGILKDKEGALGSSSDWYYVIESKVQTGFTGLSNFSNENGWWYITKGKVDFTHNGVDKNNNGWYYVTDGKVQFGFTGLADYSNSNGWWYIKNGKVDFTHNGVDKNKNGWFYVTDGKVQFGYTGVANYANSNGWWYIKNGKVDFSANTVAKNKNGWWYVLGGKVQFDFTGLANYSNENGWWYIQNGKVNFDFNGIARNQNGWWYIKGGKVDFSYSGTLNIGGITYTIKDGKVV